MDIVNVSNCFTLDHKKANQEKFVPISDIYKKMLHENNEKTDAEKIPQNLHKFMTKMNWDIGTIGIFGTLGNTCGTAYFNIMNNVDDDNTKKYQNFLFRHINNNCLLGETIFQMYDDTTLKDDENFDDMRESYQHFFAPIVIHNFINKSEFLPKSTCLQRLSNLFFDENNNKLQSAEDLYIKSCSMLFPKKKFENMKETLDIHYVIAQLNKGIVSGENILVDFLEHVEDKVWDYKYKMYSFLWMKQLEPSTKNIHLLLRYFLLEDVIFKKMKQEFDVKEIDFSSFFSQIIELIKKGYEPVAKEVSKNKNSLFVNYLLEKNLLSQEMLDLYDEKFNKSESPEEDYEIDNEEDFSDDDPINEKFELELEEKETNSYDDSLFENYESDQVQKKTMKISNLTIGLGLLALICVFIWK